MWNLNLSVFSMILRYLELEQYSFFLLNPPYWIFLFLYSFFTIPTLCNLLQIMIQIKKGKFGKKYFGKNIHTFFQQIKVRRRDISPAIHNLRHLVELCLKIEHHKIFCLLLFII